MLRHQTNLPYDNPLQLLAEVLFEVADHFADEQDAWEDVCAALSGVASPPDAAADGPPRRPPSPTERVEVNRRLGSAIHAGYAETAERAKACRYALARARRLAVDVGPHLAYAHEFPGRLETELRVFLADLSVRYERVDGVDPFRNARLLRRLSRTHVPQMLDWATRLEATAVPPEGPIRRMPPSASTAGREATEAKVAKVLSLILQYPDMPAAHYALQVGWHVKTLYKNNLIKAALKQRRAIGGLPPAGTKGADGTVEAVDDRHDGDGDDGDE